jgi:hypothetical protein
LIAVIEFPAFALASASRRLDSSFRRARMSFMPTISPDSARASCPMKKVAKLAVI